MCVYIKREMLNVILNLNKNEIKNNNTCLYWAIKEGFQYKSKFIVSKTSRILHTVHSAKL